MNTPTLYYEDFKYHNSPELREFIESDIIKALTEKVSRDVVIVLGGDGSMLSAIQKYHPEGKKFLGINFGTKGFFMNSRASVQSEEFIEKTYPLLSADVTSEKEQLSGIAVNEIDIRASSGRIVTLDIELVGKKSIRIAGDGLLVSTPAGSTGYNSSLGGPIIPHSIPAFILTPKAPWNPKGQPPIVVHEDEQIHIQDSGRKSTIDVGLDGKNLLKDAESISLKIQKHTSPLKILVAREELTDWDNKVFDEQGFS